MAESEMSEICCDILLWTIEPDESELEGHQSMKLSPRLPVIGFFQRDTAGSLQELTLNPSLLPPHPELFLKIE
jgi:hypothetical protein